MLSAFAAVLLLFSQNGFQVRIEEKKIAKIQEQKKIDIVDIHLLFRVEKFLT